jgi:hypothetical protein
MPANSSANSNSETSRGGTSLDGPSTSSSNRPPTSNVPSTSAPDEVEAASDEVKVYDEEDDDDEREANPNEKYHQVDILSAIKSSLITDTEQVRFETIRRCFDLIKVI